jgi:hypothetical protein
MASITGKSVKLTVVIDLENFPFSEIPPLGTPGGKERRISFDKAWPGACLQRLLKVRPFSGLLSPSRKTRNAELRWFRASSPTMANPSWKQALFFSRH